MTDLLRTCCCVIYYGCLFLLKHTVHMEDVRVLCFHSLVLQHFSRNIRHEVHKLQKQMFPLFCALSASSGASGASFQRPEMSS